MTAIAHQKTPRLVLWISGLFASCVFLISAWHWWTFQYGTFDLAFYVQGLWLAIRGQSIVSLLNVPILGNHAEPVVFLLAPLFALCPHPLTLILVQTLALASLPFTAWRIARHLQIHPSAALALALITVLTPATLSVGIHEFHPETLAAPLLLLLIEARLKQRSAHFWLWFLLTLSVKENIALLLVTFSMVWIGLDWKKSPAWNLRWNFLPLAVATTWLLICLQLISPMLNAGHVDYLQLYAPLGSTSGEIVRHFFTEPHRVSLALWRALTQGNLLPSLLLPLLLLPLLRPRWLCIASPLILQHLLSSRSSEWSIGAHYPAPLLPLFWIATAEVVSKVDRQKSLAFILLATTLLAHAFSGPTRQLLAEIPHLHDQLEEREAKAQLLDAIPDTASVTAPLPYLSHLATRKNLVSLHHVLKGLQTLSTTLYTPPLATDFVVVDYADPFTFSTVAGYYHPQMRTNQSAVVESSDRLLHEYLRSASWKVQSLNSLTIFTKGHPAPIPLQNANPLVFDSTTTLHSIEQIRDEPTFIQLRFGWKFTGERQRFPWGMLVLSNGQHLYPIIKGAASPQIADGEAGEDWTCVFPSHLPHGDYSLFLLFFDHNQAAWESKLPPNDPTFTQHKIPLGNHRISSPP